MPAPGIVEIVFQRDRRAHRLRHRLHRGFRLDSAPQIGMQHGARQVEYRTQRALLTGAEDACIVNNNAAAVLLMLAATASGKDVVVSRGELVVCTFISSAVCSLIA
jgi:seryl-tRNA(Sec) selenium transferase